MSRDLGGPTCSLCPPTRKGNRPPHQPSLRCIGRQLREKLIASGLVRLTHGTRAEASFQRAEYIPVMLPTRNRGPGRDVGVEIWVEPWIDTLFRMHSRNAHFGVKEANLSLAHRTALLWHGVADPKFGDELLGISLLNERGFSDYSRAHLASMPQSLQRWLLRPVPKHPWWQEQWRVYRMSGDKLYGAPNWYPAGLVRHNEGRPVPKEEPPQMALPLAPVLGWTTPD